MISPRRWFAPIILLLLPGTGLLNTTTVFGHGGGLNSSGCHNNRKTGGYHCHRSSSRSSGLSSATRGSSPNHSSTYSGLSNPSSESRHPTLHKCKDVDGRTTFSDRPCRRSTADSAVTKQYFVVKKSRLGICHGSSSPYYSRTKHYQPFDSLEACLQSGGRLPKR